MIKREIAPYLIDLFQRYPFVTVTGPRQSGKTTLCRETFPHLSYVNLEAPDQREFAESDPRGMLARLGTGAIIDEIQRVPSLLSYLQVVGDEHRENSLYILTGSQQFKLSDAINQSLAGRTALLHLLPFSMAERKRIKPSESVEELLYGGFYPRVHDQSLEPRQAYADYIATYVERDVRQVGEIRNVSSFQRFVRLCAGRVGQLVNLSSLGSDAGVSHVTARHWLTLLEASYIAFRLSPLHTNIRKRLVKSPKLYFYDVGLAAHLIGIEHAEQLASHPLRGALFENMIVVECLKYRFNRGRRSNLSFYRDSRGLECDLLFEAAEGTVAIEIKSGMTIASDYFAKLSRIVKLIPNVSKKVVVYGGTERQSRKAGEVVPFAELQGFIARIESERKMAAFVRDKIEAKPRASDMHVLDAVYRREIRPTIDELGTSFKDTLTMLFRSTSSVSYLVVDGEETNSSGLLQPRQWERTKQQYLVTRGFRLSDQQRVEIRHDFNFVGYTGNGNGSFNVVISVAWRLGASEYRRDVSLNGAPIPQLKACIRYADGEGHHGDLDNTVAKVLETAIGEISHRSTSRSVTD